MYSGYMTKEEFIVNYGEVFVDDFLRWMRGQTVIMGVDAPIYSEKQVNKYLNDDHELDYAF